MAKESSIKKPKQSWLNMSSHQIVSLLESQHAKDVCVSECKDGPSWFGGHSRMDVWVMNKSWSQLCFTGYEIKVSRNDFKQDNKWHAYLPLCNQLYFVCPRGMIQPEEVPGDVGLKWASEKRVSTVKKAAHRECQPPMELFCYILMCRTRIVEPNFYQPETKEGRLEKYRKWLAEKEESRRLGQVVRYAIALQIERIEDSNVHLINEIKKYEAIRKFALDVGITRWDGENQIKEKLVQFQNSVPPEYLRKIREVVQSSNELIELLQPPKADENPVENKP